MLRENVELPDNAGRPVQANGGQHDDTSVASVRSHLQSGKVKKVKKLIRTRAIDVQCPKRSELWLELSRYHSCHNHTDSFFRNNDNASNSTSLPPFVDPVFVDDYWLNEEGRRQLYRVINTVGNSHSHILYAPLLYPTAALLLHYLQPEDAYKTICAMIDSKTCVNHLDQTPNTYSKSALVFQKLTKKLSPKVHKWVESSLSAKNEEISQFFLSWPLWLFRALPMSYLLRVFDNFLLEGVRALYRSCLQILILYSQAGSTNNTSGSNATPKDILSSHGVIQQQQSSQGMLSDTSFAKRLRSSIRKSLRATPKVRRKFEVAASMLDGITAFIRHDLPNMVTVDQFIGKAFSISGISAKKLNKLGSNCGSAEIMAHSKHLPFNLSNCKELTVQDIVVNNVDPLVAGFIDDLGSQIATQSQLVQLWEHIPDRFTVLKPYIIFTTNEHGTSLRNFLLVVDQIEPLIIIIKTNDGDIFGAFCSTRWGEGKTERFFGTGETFVFTYHKSDDIKVYKWVGFGAPCDTHLSTAQQLFQCAIGGLDVGCGALKIPMDMLEGRTDRSSTFDNEPLAQDKTFKILTLEAYAFQ